MWEGKGRKERRSRREKKIVVWGLILMWLGT